MEEWLTLFDYQCKVCHYTYFDTSCDCDCPQCETENHPLRISIYHKIGESAYLELEGDD